SSRRGSTEAARRATIASLTAAPADGRIGGVPMGRWGLRRSWLTAALAVPAALILAASPTLAMTWTSTTLRVASGLALQDAACAGHRVADVGQDPGPRLELRTSTTDGSSFGSIHVVSGHARQAAAAWCGSSLYVAYARDWSSASGVPNTWFIDVDVR